MSNEVEKIFEAGGGVQTIVKMLEPEIKKMAEPLYKKLTEYLGDDDRIIVIHVTGKGQSPHAVVIDRNKQFEINSNPENKIENKTFTGDGDAIQHFVQADEFLEMVLNGGLSKMMDKNE